MQEQAETNGDGMWVLEEMVWVTEWTKQEASEGGGRAKSNEGRATHRDDFSQLWTSTGFYTHYVPTVRACDHN